MPKIGVSGMGAGCDVVTSLASVAAMRAKQRGAHKRKWSKRGHGSLRNRVAGELLQDVSDRSNGTYIVLLNVAARTGHSRWICATVFEVEVHHSLS